LSTCSRCLNTARFLLGEEPIEVVASQYSSESDARFAEVEEAILWQMRFPSGIACWERRAGLTWTLLFSYEGLKLKRSRIADDTSEFPAPSIEQISTKVKNQFALEMDHFAECVVSGQQPWTPGEE
jgi:predicted dehydrogenase